MVSSLVISYVKHCSIISIPCGLDVIRKKYEFFFDLLGIRTHSGLVRFRRIAPGIVPANQSLYKLEKQSGQESFRPINPAETNKASILSNPHGRIESKTNKPKQNSSFGLG
jgi:hypothetical protein